MRPRRIPVIVHGHAGWQFVTIQEIARNDAYVFPDDSFRRIPIRNGFRRVPISDGGERHQQFVSMDAAAAVLDGLRPVPVGAGGRHRGFVRLTDISVPVHGGTGSSTANKVADLEEVRVQDEEKDCSICLEDLCRGEVASRLRCSHIFHKKCINRWLRSSCSCPICRMPASLLDV